MNTSAKRRKFPQFNFYDPMGLRFIDQSRHILYTYVWNPVYVLDDPPPSKAGRLYHNS